MNSRPAGGLLHAEFLAQAERTPDAIALREDGASITYAELARRSWALRARLGSAGVGEGSLVALHLEPSIDYVAALLAVLQTGAAAVPLPPSYPEARRRDVLAFARFDAVVVGREGSSLPAGAPRVATLDAGERAPSDGSAGATPAPAADAGDRPAFVLCSSGSTGQPKLIVRSHASFFHRLRWTWREHPYAAGEACCLKSFMTTTHAVYELFEPLLRGVAVHIFSDAQVRDVEGFFAALGAKAVTRLLAVPSLLRAGLDLPGFVPPPLRVLVLMGEAVDARLADRALQAFPRDTKVYSIYGSTEASSTVVCDLRTSPRPDGELPLGKPIAPEVRLHVHDPEGAPVPPGQAGRLYVAGSALFTGYFRSPELTASVLNPGPDGPGPLYDTRDQVRVTESGELLFVGRVDDTVKVRGFRVELSEVERVLAQQPAVREAAVVARPGEDGSAALVGFFAPASGEPAALFAALRQALPAYMVPSALVGLDALPRTPNGKLDRRRLKDLPTSASTGASPEQREPSPTEREVLEVWRTVLGHDVRLDSQFFEIGGTSLSVFTALRRLRERPRLGAAALSEQAFYRYPTPAALAAHIDALRGRAVEAAARNAVLVTLKTGEDPELAPLFLISSAGGTLGAYHKLAGALRTRREVVGVRDPFLWGERDPTAGFQRWVAIYREALRERQPHGPYFIGAYSSAAVFAYELAQGLQRAGERVELLAMVDPLAFDRASKARFGYWVLRARVGRAFLRPLVRLAGRLRRLATRARSEVSAPPVQDVMLTAEQLESLARRARESRSHILGLSALLELNSGLPFALRGTDLAGVPPAGYLGVLRAKVASVTPDLDPRTLENIVVQYYLQTGAQHAYRLQPYPGRLTLFEPRGPHRGLFAAQFAPCVAELRVVSLPFAPRPEHVRLLATAFGDSLTAHYLSMRDDTFVAALAAELDRLL